MNIFVGNLAFEASPEELKKAFEKFGEVSLVRIMMNDKGTKSRGFAFLEMPDEAQARKAIAALNGLEFIGRQIVVGVARPKPGEAPEKPKVKRHRGNFRAEGNRRKIEREQYPGYGEGGGYRGGQRMRGRISGTPHERPESAGQQGRPAEPWVRRSNAGKRPWRGKEGISGSPQGAWKKRDESPAVPFRRGERSGAERKERGRFVKPWERKAESSGTGRGGREKPWSKSDAGRPERPWGGEERNYGRPQKPWQKRDEGSPAPFRRGERPGAERKERGRFVKPWERRAAESSGNGRGGRARSWSRPSGGRPEKPWGGEEKNSGRPQGAWKKRDGSSAVPFRRGERPGAEHKERGRFVKPWERRAESSGTGRGGREKPWSKSDAGRPERPWSGKEKSRGGPSRPWNKRDEGQAPFRRGEHKAAGHRGERGGSVKPWEREKRAVYGARPFRPSRRRTGAPVRDDSRGKSWSKPEGRRRSRSG